MYRNHGSIKSRNIGVEVRCNIFEHDYLLERIKKYVSCSPLDRDK